MLPFIRIADLQIGIPIHIFGLLVATGVMLGTVLTVRRARQRGVNVDELNSFITWMLVSGFLGAHWLNDLMYEPKLVMKDPLRLLRIWESISSFGGFVGAIVGVLLWKYIEAVPWIALAGIPVSKFRLRKTPAPILPLADLVASVFPLSWVFGRSGCSVAHDHIGAVADKASWLTVGAPSTNVHELMSSYKGPPGFALVHGEFPRYDLGLLEMMFTVFLAVFCILTWRRKLPTGSYLAITAMAYAPVRFVMDYFRLEENDVRYGTLTPAQWMCFGLFVVGLYMAYLTRKLHKSGIDPMRFFYVDLTRKQRRAALKAPVVESVAAADAG
jgi:phosphatidylglycerol---prolipoprotein diacylglyceryl transferase